MEHFAEYVNLLRLTATVGNNATTNSVATH